MGTHHRLFWSPSAPEPGAFLIRQEISPPRLSSASLRSSDRVTVQKASPLEDNAACRAQHAVGHSRACGGRLSLAALWSIFHLPT